MKIKYVIDEGPAQPYADIDENGEFETDWNEDNAEYIASDAAEDLFGKGDSSDPSDWPMTFHIYSVDDEKLLGTYEMHMEYEPYFSANEITE